ncbi:ATP-dependent DNA ligase [Nitrobacteraceae bacterium AZCC 2161]
MAFQRRKPAAIGVKAPFPGFIEPALGTSIEKAPSGERWIHEIKFDGYRVQVHLGQRFHSLNHIRQLRRVCKTKCG